MNAISNSPVKVPRHFRGREDALAAIEVAMRRYEGVVTTTALHGLRGVGKTVLAAAYADRHRGEYRAVWWLRAETEATLRADLLALGPNVRSLWHRLQALSGPTSPQRPQTHVIRLSGSCVWRSGVPSLMVMSRPRKR